MCICIAVLSFASVDRPYALKIKYPMTKGYQFFAYVFCKPFSTPVVSLLYGFGSGWLVVCSIISCLLAVF